MEPCVLPPSAKLFLSIGAFNPLRFEVIAAEDRSHLSQVGLRLTLEPRVTWNVHTACWLGLPRAVVAGMHHGWFCVVLGHCACWAHTGPVELGPQALLRPFAVQLLVLCGLVMASPCPFLTSVTFVFH